MYILNLLSTCYYSYGMESLCRKFVCQDYIEGEVDLEEQANVLDEEVEEIEPDVDDNVLDIWWYQWLGLWFLLLHKIIGFGFYCCIKH